MSPRQIKNGNRVIAEFLGYTYYHKGIEIDDSDCGGLYTTKEVFSKVPIEFSEHDDEAYFNMLPNPDYKNEKSVRFRSDWERLCWSTINSRNYLTDLAYHSSFEWQMTALEKIESVGYEYIIDRYGCHINYFVSNYTEKIIVSEEDVDKKTNIWLALVKFAKWYKKNGKVRN